MKNELQSLRLFTPLFPHIYRKNEWGDLDDYREDLSAGEILEHEDKILSLIQRDKLPSEGERGLTVYLDDDLSQKVYSINPSVEEWNGELWGVTEVQTHGTLSPSELAELTDWLSGQFSDGWDEGLEQREIKVEDGELYLSLMNNEIVRIDTAAIPKVEMRIFCSAIADLAKRLMEDPKHRAEFEAWQKERLKAQKKTVLRDEIPEDANNKKR